jgi:hypothetical protein
VVADRILDRVRAMLDARDRHPPTGADPRPGVATQGADR